LFDGNVVCKRANNWQLQILGFSNKKFERFIEKLKVQLEQMKAGNNARLILSTLCVSRVNLLRILTFN